MAEASSTDTQDSSNTMTQVLLRPSEKTTSLRFWLGFALIALVAATIAALFWVLDHPFGTNWDEARYINNALKDVSNLRTGGLFELAKGLVAQDRTRPPAFRILVLPLTLIFGVHPALLRLISLVGLGVTLGFTFLAARCIAGVTAGAFAAVFLLTCPIVLGPHMRFYVDYPLYVAIAAFLYFLFRQWDREKTDRPTWVGMGGAMGLGAMAKPPIVFVVAPVLALTLVLERLKIIRGPKLIALMRATGVAVLVMLPWWAINGVPAVKKAFRSGGNSRHALGAKGSLETLVDWLVVLVQSMLGPALTLLAVAILVTVVVRVVQRQFTVNSTQVTAIVGCFAAGLPMFILGLLGSNHNPRLIAPALVPLAIAFGSLAALTGWTTSRWLSAAAAALLAFQMVVMVSPSGSDGRYQQGDALAQGLLWGNPSTVMRRSEQWDWFQLKALTDDLQLQNPLVAYLGNAVTYNVPQIARPWVQANEPVGINWLWQYREGDINWEQVMARVAASHVVITAPTLKGSASDRQDLDNQHNRELVDRLSQDPRFDAPLTLMMGRFEPTPLLVFIQKPGQTPAPVPEGMNTDAFH